MAFFEDLGKKLSQAGQTAVQKTKEMTDIARLNGAIAEQERKISDTYIEIGKLYVLNHPEDYEDDFAPMIASLKESDDRIKDLRQQIQDIKGVVRCEKCGAEIGNNVAFCSSCGAKRNTNENPKLPENCVRCAECGEMVDKSSKFCVFCGKPMAADEAVEEEGTSTNDVANN